MSAAAAVQLDSCVDSTPRLTHNPAHCRKRSENKKAEARTEPEYTEYPEYIVNLVLKLRQRFGRGPGVTAHLIVEELQRRHIRLTEDDVNEIIDRRLDSLEGELAQVDSIAEWTRAERRQICRQRMAPLEVA